MLPSYSIGVDVGGSHVTCAVVHIQEGRLLEGTEARAAYHHEAPASEILQCWAQALNQTLEQVKLDQLAGIGFAIPGPFDYAKGISEMRHKFPKLFGLHIPSVLQPLLHTEYPLTMRFLNDASAFAVGEAWLGEGKGYQNVVAITLGTGFGSAFTRHGVPVVKGPTVPKEGCLWHLPFQEGIADDYFSTRWFVQEYAKRSGETLPGVKELIDRADQEPLIRELFVIFGHNLAACLSRPLQLFEAEVLIIGGNIAHGLPLFQDVFEADLIKNGVKLRVCASRLKEHAALIGGARLLDDAFWQRVSAELPEI